MSAMRVLMDSIVDYAGLFPPAKLGMPEAVANYAKYRRSERAWMLARFIAPVARLDEFARHGEPLWSADTPEDGPWFVSALIGDDLDADIDRIFAFNQRFAPAFAPFEDGAAPQAMDEQATPGEPPSELGAVIDTIELKAASGRDIDRALKIIPEQLEPYFEIDWRGGGGDTRGVVSALAGTGARAKIRTGGVTPDQIPPSEAVAAFIAQCAAADVPFKATAGLHHAIRAERPLTYEPGCARGTMHGFINVFMAAAFIKSAAWSAEQAAALLNETDASAFRFGESHASWRGQEIGAARLAAVRERFAISFGSCSFDEPVEGVRGMDK